MALIEKLTAIADAIRAKLGTSDQMTLEQMASAVASIPTGSADVHFELSGTNAALVDEQNFSWDLSDTSFVVGSTNPTSATSIRAAESYLYKSPTLAFGNKDIVTVQTVTVTPTHSSGATQKALSKKYIYQYVTWACMARNNATSATKGTRRSFNIGLGWNRYLNASGTDSIANAAYGMYATPAAASTASNTAASTYVRANSPTLNCRASATYESQANMLLITECTFEWNIKVYTVDPGSNIASVMYDAVLDGLAK